MYKIMGEKISFCHFDINPVHNTYLNRVKKSTLLHQLKSNEKFLKNYGSGRLFAGQKSLVHLCSPYNFKVA